MRRITAILTAIFMILTCSWASASGVEVDMTGAKSAILVDAESGTVILGKDADKKVEVAGLKRLPALLTVCEAFDSGRLTGDNNITVSSEAARVKGVTAFLSPNEHIKAELLLKAAVMLTAGDAIHALLDAAYPGDAAKNEAISKRLKELGAEAELKSFMGEGALFSANDIVKICKTLSKSEAFLKYSSVYLESIEHENASKTELTNPNRLVRFYSGCFGLATGSVGASEYSGAFIARRGATTFLAVVAGMPDSASRFKLASEMLDYGFATYRSAELFKAGEALATVPVVGGKLAETEVIAKNTVSVLTPIADTKVFQEMILPEFLEAPVAEGEAVGSLIIKNSEGITLREIPLIAGSAVEKAAFSDYFMTVLRSWLRLDLKEYRSD